MASTMNGGGKLVAPERNNFFYGKLMDVSQFEKEQRYFNQKRLLLNRLVLGSGVVCGLNVIAGTEGMVVVQPGVAIDPLGREIVVAESISIDPHQRTDDLGSPTGEPVTDGIVSICLAYAEACTDLVPVLVPDCDTPGNCAFSTFHEGFRILVRQATGAVPEPLTCKLNWEEFPPQSGASLHELLHASLCERIEAACLEPSTDCVLLGSVTLGTESIAINPCTGRRLVYSNALLYELVLCLAERVNKLAGGQ